MTNIHYIDYSDVIEAHEKALEKSGGLPGVLDGDRIKSVLGHMQDDDYYPKFIDKLAHLQYSLIKNHSFLDGNKRTSLSVSGYFLHKNNYSTETKYNYHIIMEEAVVLLAGSQIERPFLKRLITAIIDENTQYAALRSACIEQIKNIRKNTEDEETQNERIAFTIVLWMYALEENPEVKDLSVKIELETFGAYIETINKK